ncbi:hypothetical protein OO013_05270 [Mangrovivirga sp. M17]|uniref:Outer membrane protein with beta-barrel domain n=1 Tax=Mangrovivirga halotolerans TaxID=2993936 RepID=A0ABT3RPJ4_9BACT|nr:hypothetical protein [Mangrovivirga halotolerans]MCX2743263.1 hypothetical protein [Mangrovivirga halotolerans]
MKPFCTTFFVLIVSFLGFSQEDFKQGYFINSEGQRFDALIKDILWDYPPESITVKLPDSQNLREVLTKDIREIGIGSEAKMIFKTVKVDKSSSETNKLNFDEAPDFSTEEVMLQVLIEGKANLYKYQKGKSFIRFYFSDGNGDIKPLIYKKYMANERQIKENDEYRRQLWRELKNNDLSVNYYNNILYREKDLIQYFTKYNLKFTEPIKVYERETKHRLSPIEISIRPGITISSLDVENSLANNNRLISYQNTIGYRLGINISYKLPFTNNKGAMFIEPTFSWVNFEGENSYQIIKLEYTSVEMLMGGRYHIPLSSNNSIFLSAAAVIKLGLGSTIQYESGTVLETSDYNFTPALGLGYENRNFNIEIIYQFPHNLLHNYGFWKGTKTSLELNVGYKIKKASKWHSTKN